MKIWLIPIKSLCEYCKQGAPTCSKQMNVTTFCMDIPNNLYWVIATAPYPTRIIGVQIAELQLKQPWLNQPRIFFALIASHEFSFYHTFMPISTVVYVI